MSQQTVEDRKKIFSNAERVVVKIGSSLISGASRKDNPLAFGELLVDLEGHLRPDTAICIVSSGAVALGRKSASVHEANLASKQAQSAIGQIDLMVRWQDALRSRGRTAAQVLLTPDVTRRRRQYLNARATLRELLHMGAVPVVNENDAVATEELRYGDNDRLAATAAGLINADLLVLLTDVGGLYSHDPNKNPDAKHFPRLPYSELDQFDRGKMESQSGVGTGGMATKIDAARMAGSWGCATVLMDGRPDRPFSAFVDHPARGTLIEASTKPAPARRKWLTGLAPDGGAVVVDAGAAKALLEHASLLSVGVTETRGMFSEGDVVAILTEQGTAIGFGLAKIPGDSIDPGQKQIVFHRDDIVLE